MNNSILPTQEPSVKEATTLEIPPDDADWPAAWLAMMEQHLLDREPGTSADYGLADLDYDEVADVASALTRLLAEGEGWTVDAATLARCREIEAEAPRWWLGEMAA